MEFKKKNKKGNIQLIVIFFALLFLVLMLGFIMVTGSAVINWVFDEAVPELSNLGTVGDTNMTDVASYTLAPVNSVVQSFTWLTGVLYVMFLIGCFGFVMVMRTAPSRWLMGFWFAITLILILGSMFISNMYEEFYDGTDDLATRLKEHTLLSYMILYSPAIFVVISFVTGAILFSGVNQEGYA